MPVQPPPNPAERLRAVRVARERLCRAAADPRDADIEPALELLVRAASDAGFLAATVSSLVSVVLESELPRGGSRRRRQSLVERWVSRARELYDRRSGMGREA